MSKNFKLNFILASLFIVTPSVMFAQDIDPPPAFEEIDPPPAATIDNSIAVLVVLGLLFAAYYFYKSNIKMQKK